MGLVLTHALGWLIKSQQKLNEINILYFIIKKADALSLAEEDILAKSILLELRSSYQDQAETVQEFPIELLLVKRLRTMKKIKKIQNNYAKDSVY